MLTTFPEMFGPILNESITGRAIENKLICVNCVNIRDFSLDKHHKTDDYPYGGGNGMVMLAQPIYDAWKSIASANNLVSRPLTIYMSPQGIVLNQAKIRTLATQEKHIIILCGHYEGVDERVLEEIVDEEISIGDYVLTGGELPAMVLIDSICRHIPGVLSNSGSAEEDSHSSGLLEYPQYTRPDIFMERCVPDVLLSGHHANIDAWRYKMSIERTKIKRPDLYKKYVNSGDSGK